VSTVMRNEDGPVCTENSIRLDAGRDALILLPVRAENLNPDVLVMQPAKQGVRHDAPDLLNRARDRRILVQ
jgi:hypothetical protein